MFCELCNGKGRIRAGDKYVKCECVRPNDWHRQQAGKVADLARARIQAASQLSLHQEETNQVAFERNEMTGALFANEKREKQSQPNYTGGVLIRGVDYRLAGWIKTDRNGKTYLSLAATAPEPDDDPDLPVTEDDAELPF